MFSIWNIFNVILVPTIWGWLSEILRKVLDLWCRSFHLINSAILVMSQLICIAVQCCNSIFRLATSYHAYIKVTMFK